MGPKIDNEFLSADYRYMAWIVAQGLAQVHLKQLAVAAGFDGSLPAFHESEWIAFTLAMRIWEEFGFPNSWDYALDPDPRRSEVARKKLVSSTEWSVPMQSFSTKNERPPIGQCKVFVKKGKP